MAALVLNFLSLAFPVIVAGSLLMGWSHVTRSLQLRRTLRRFTWIFGPPLLILSAALSVTIKTCTGNIIYGFENCALFSDSVAQTITWLNFFGFAVGIISFAALLLVGLVAEVLARRRAQAA